MGTAWYKRFTDRQTVAGLVLFSVLIRLPFLRFFELVNYDGTYYINQARALFAGAPMPGQFPVGYPLLIALLLPVAGDGELAARIVSFIASVGTVVVFYAIARRFLSRPLAALAGALLAVSPLFMGLSLSTLSESAYVFWMLLALLLFLRADGPRADLFTGLAAGMATITRNEMLAVVALLALVRALVPPRRMKGAVMLLAGFAVVYSVNVVAFYRSSGELELMQKTEFFGTRAQRWVDRERAVGGSVGEETGAGDATPSTSAIVRSYARDLPVNLWHLTREVAIVALLLAVFGAWRRPSWILLALVPLLAVPLFIVRTTDRYLFPYVPIVLLFAVIGADRLRPAHRRLALAALGVAALAGAVWNVGHLTSPADDDAVVLKDVGLALRDRVRPGDLLADRKPYTAFYAGARYIELPLDNYDATLNYLTRENVRFVTLFFDVVDKLRPVMTPLLTDPAVVLGELRYRQTYRHDSSVIVYERTGNDDGLTWHKLAQADGDGSISSPTWSPDGLRIAFVAKAGGNSAIRAVAAAGGATPVTLVDTPAHDDHPAFSPDGGTLAFASTMPGNWDILTVDLSSGTLRNLTAAPSNEGAPAWFPDGRSVVFVSDRGGKKDLWRTAPGGGDATRVTSLGGADFPAVSPDGTRIAFVVSDRGVGILDLESGRAGVTGPSQVQFAPSWSPDGRFLAVTGKDWGSVDVYLVMPETARHLLLTKNYAHDSRRWFDGYPVLSPDGNRLALVSTFEGPMALYVLEGLEPYYARLVDPIEVITFEDSGQ